MKGPCSCPTDKVQGSDDMPLMLYGHIQLSKDVRCASPVDEAVGFNHAHVS